jgi:hypothetical protein
VYVCVRGVECKPHSTQPIRNRERDLHSRQYNADCNDQHYLTFIVMNDLTFIVIHVSLSPFLEFGQVSVFLTK